MLIDDFILHLYETQNTFFYYQLAFDQVLILLTWVSIRNSRPSRSNTHIFLLGFTLIISSIVYAVFFIRDYGKDVLITISMDLNLFFVHELLANAFVIGVVLLLAYYQMKSGSEMHPRQKVDMLSSGLTKG